MADLLDFAGVRAFTTNAEAGAGYVARFYQSGTTNPVTVYTSSDLGTAHGASVTADASGIFPAVWASGGDVKAVIETDTGAVVQTIDPVFSYSADATGAAGVSFEPTVDLPFTNVQAAIEGAAASAASGFSTYGIGITGNATLLANIDATNIGAGVYRFDGTTTGTLPTGVAAADTGLVEHWRQASATAMQFLFHATTDRVFHRRMASSAWGTWREVITSNQAPAEGDILYRGASAWTRLVKGTGGQHMVMNAGATAPAWTSGSRVLLASKTASNSTALAFTEFNNAVYRWYEFELTHLIPATDGAFFLMRTSTNGGSSYDSGASDYAYGMAGTDSTSTTTDASNANASIILTHSTLGVGNAANEYGVSGFVKVMDPAATAYTEIQHTINFWKDNGTQARISGGGARLAAADVDAVQFRFSTGNITSGTIRMYGIA
jgi:hypothetical protein